MALIGADSRTRIQDTATPPYCYVVHLRSRFRNGTALTGTGFLVGLSTVVTAWHCVFQPGGVGLAVSAVVTPGKNGEQEPFGCAQAVKAFGGGAQTGAERDDWAVLTLSRPLGKKTGYFNLPAEPLRLARASVRCVGYPSPATCRIQETAQGLAFESEGRVRAAKRLLMRGDWDATSGNSGGPVFVYEPGLGYTAVGILTGGSPGVGGQHYPRSYTSALRLPQALLRAAVTPELLQREGRSLVPD